MKRLFIAIALQLLTASIFCQDNIQKARKRFDSLLAKTTYGNNPAAGKYYSIRGFKMYCETYGSGQPLLIIHGNGGSISDFVLQIPYFAQKYTVIIADSRSQGKSADKGDSLTYEMMADDYAALLTEMKLDSVNVIGWSDGGINALLLAIRHPKKVKKLAVTGANLRPDTTAVYPEVLSMVSPNLNMLKAKKTLNDEEKTGLKLLRLLIEQPNIPLTDISKISVPALVIGGDHDVIKEEHTMEIYKNMSQAYLWILPNSGHSTPIVYADDFNKKVDDFFSNTYRKITKGARFF
jgi:pimeloyl-ACP methyl ester carboxylesterase